MTRASILAAALLVLLQATQVVAQPVCKPVLTVRGVGYSGSINLRRFWTASVDVDASQCATSSGLYSLGFVRTAEDGLDLEFDQSGNPDRRASVSNSGPMRPFTNTGSVRWRPVRAGPTDTPHSCHLLS